MPGSLTDTELFLNGPAVAMRWHAAPTWAVAGVTPNAEQLLGSLPPLPFSYLERVHPDDRPRVDEAFARCAAEDGTVCRFEPYRVCDEKGCRWVEQYAMRRHSRDSELVGYLLDVTEWQSARQTLHESETRYRTLWEHLHDAAFLADPDSGRIVDTNAQGEALLGRSRDEIIGMSQAQLHPHGQEAYYRQKFATHLKQGRAADFDGEVVRVDGTIVPVFITAAPLTVEGRHCILGLFHDLTARRQVEEALRASEARLAEAQRLAHIGSWEWLIDEDRVRWSDEVYRIFGVAPGSFGNRYQSYLERVHPLDRRELEARVHDAVTHEQPYQIEHRIVWPDGTTRLMHCEGEFSPADGTRGRRLVGTVQDITERTAVEAELARGARELARKGRRLESANRRLHNFAYVISHDLKAPLRAVSYLADAVLDDAHDAVPPATADRLELLASRVRRMHALIEALLDYSARAEFRGEIDEVDVDRLVAGVIDRLVVPAGFHIERHGLPVLETDGTALEQVLSHLIVNALEHHDRPEGWITVAARRLGEWYEFSVCDDGPGIPEPYRDQVFQMFQTLDEPERDGRLGIGLALVKELVDERGGRIVVESGKERGTTVRFTWPRRLSAYD